MSTSILRYMIFLTENARQEYEQHKVLKTFIGKGASLPCRKIDPSPHFLIAEVLWEPPDKELVCVEVHIPYSAVRAILTTVPSNKDLGFLLEQPQEEIHPR